MLAPPDNTLCKHGHVRVIGQICRTCDNIRYREKYRRNTAFRERVKLRSRTATAERKNGNWRPYKPSEVVNPVLESRDIPKQDLAVWYEQGWRVASFMGDTVHIELRR